MKDKAEFAVNILLEYAKENGINGRDTTDLSPLESWMILRLYNIEGQRSEQLVCQCEIPNCDMQGVCFKCNLKVGVRPAN